MTELEIVTKRRFLAIRLKSKEGAVVLFTQKIKELTSDINQITEELKELNLNQVINPTNEII